MPNYKLVFEVTTIHVVEVNHPNAMTAIEDARHIVKNHSEGEVKEFKLKSITDLAHKDHPFIGGGGVGGSGSHL